MSKGSICHLMLALFATTIFVNVADAGWGNCHAHHNSQRYYTYTYPAPPVSSGCSRTVAPSLPTPPPAPEPVPFPTPKATPRVAPKVTPSVPPRVTPKVTPSVTPRVTPKVTPNVPPKVTPKATNVAPDGLPIVGNPSQLTNTPALKTSPFPGLIEVWDLNANRKLGYSRIR